MLKWTSIIPVRWKSHPAFLHSQKKFYACHASKLWSSKSTTEMVAHSISIGTDLTVQYGSTPHKRGTAKGHKIIIADVKNHDKIFILSLDTLYCLPPDEWAYQLMPSDASNLCRYVFLKKCLIHFFNFTIDCYSNFFVDGWCLLWFWLIFIQWLIKMSFNCRKITRPFLRIW